MIGLQYCFKTLSLVTFNSFQKRLISLCFSFQFVQLANMAWTVRLAANVLVRQYVIRIQLSVSVNPAVKGQLVDKVSTEQ